jgi:sugar phosphate isomerase/epimerase
MGAGKKRSWKEEVAMDKFSHYLSMVSICRVRAFEDKARRTEWLNWAEAWNELAGEALDHPTKAQIANRSSDIAQSNLETVE